MYNNLCKSEDLGGNNLYSVKKEVINDRAGVHLYLKQGNSIPDKIKKAIQPLLKSLEGHSKTNNCKN